MDIGANKWLLLNMKISRLIFPLIIIFLMYSVGAYSKKFSCGEHLNVDYLFAKMIEIDGLPEKTIYFEQINMLKDNRYAELKYLYNQCIFSRVTHNSLARLNKKNLHKLYFILNAIFRFTQDVKVMNEIDDIIIEKELRGENTETYIKQKIKNLISIRKFSEAKELENKLGNSKTLIPQIVFSAAKNNDNDQDIYTIYKPNLMNETYNEVNFKIPKGGYIIGVLSPICNASKRFSKWLKDNNKIQERLNQNTLFIVPQEIPFEFADNKQMMLSFIKNKYDWQFVTYWGTPTLYFFYDGKLIGQLIGWPEKGNKVRFSQLMSKINL